MEKRVEPYILIICQNAGIQASLIHVFGQIKESFDIVFKDSIEASQQLLLARKPELLVLTWFEGTLEKNATFLQFFRGHASGASTPIVVLSDVLSRQILCISTEYHVTKILNLATFQANLLITVEDIFVEQRKPSLAHALVKKIESAGVRGELGEQQEHIQDFFNLHPNDSRAQIEFANLCVQRGDFSKACQLAEKVLAKDKNNLRASNVLARAYMHEHKFGEALLILEEADALSPKNLDRIVIIADVYRTLEDNQNAKKHYNEALKLNPNHKGARTGMGQVELSEGEINSALALFGDAATEEEIGGFFNTAAIFAVRKTNFEKSIELYTAAQNALKSNILKSKVVYNLGLAYKKWGKPDNAIPFLRQALELNPEFEKAAIKLQELMSAEIIVDENDRLSEDIVAEDKLSDSALSILHAEDKISDSALEILNQNNRAMKMDDSKEIVKQKFVNDNPYQKITESKPSDKKKKIENSKIADKSFYDNSEDSKSDFGDLNDDFET